MKINSKNHNLQLGLLGLSLAVSVNLFAGNKDRVGQSGAHELKINPWAKSSGMAGANSASVNGLEAVSLNVAGLAFTKKTDLMFTRTSWLTGSQISLNAFGLGQKIGESSVLGISIESMNFGDLDITTVDLPEGGSGTYSPQYLMMNLSYAKAFSNSIYGGLTVKSISETMSTTSARGVAFDAGIRYVTGVDNQMKFGIALRNVGPKMKYTGDGLSTKKQDVYNGSIYTVEYRADGFELPALLSIGGSYDILIKNASSDSLSATEEGKAPKVDHRVTIAGTFTSNSFGKDQLLAGLEYSFRSLIQVRAGYIYEKGMGSKDNVDLTSAYTGPTAGASIQVPLGKKGTILGIDYSYRATISFSGTHSIGLRLNI